MSLYNVFPKTDCRKCGEKSRFNHAAKAFSGELNSHGCPDIPSQMIERMVTPVTLGWPISFKER
jgi:ArsR family metal-binding transcriptional regulator